MKNTTIFIIATFTILSQAESRNMVDSPSVAQRISGLDSLIITPEAPVKVEQVTPATAKADQIVKVEIPNTKDNSYFNPNRAPATLPTVNPSAPVATLTPAPAPIAVEIPVPTTVVASAPVTAAAPTTKSFQKEDGWAELNAARLELRRYMDQLNQPQPISNVSVQVDSVAPVVAAQIPQQAITTNASLPTLAVAQVAPLATGPITLEQELQAIEREESESLPVLVPRKKSGGDYLQVASLSKETQTPSVGRMLSDLASGSSEQLPDVDAVDAGGTNYELAKLKVKRVSHFEEDVNLLRPLNRKRDKESIYEGSSAKSQ